MSVLEPPTAALPDLRFARFGRLAAHRFRRPRCGSPAMRPTTRRLLRKATWCCSRTPTGWRFRRSPASTRRTSSSNPTTGSTSISAAAPSGPSRRSTADTPCVDDTSNVTGLPRRCSGSLMITYYVDNNRCGARDPEIPRLMRRVNNEPAAGARRRGRGSRSHLRPRRRRQQPDRGDDAALHRRAAT